VIYTSYLTLGAGWPKPCIGCPTLSLSHPRRFVTYVCVPGKPRGPKALRKPKSPEGRPVHVPPTQPWCPTSAMISPVLRLYTPNPHRSCRPRQLPRRLGPASNRGPRQRSQDCTLLTKQVTFYLCNGRQLPHFIWFPNSVKWGSALLWPK